MAISRERQLINTLRNHPASAKELADEYQISINFIRKLADQMERTGSLHKTKNQRTVIYNLVTKFRRNVPIFKVTMQNGEKGFARLDDLITMKDRSEASKSMDFLPALAVRLLKAGREYEYMKANISEDIPEYNKRNNKIKRDLVALKDELNVHLFNINKTLSILQQIQGDENFWKPEHLQQYFNNQLDYEGKLIPTINTVAFLEACNYYLGAVDE